MTDLKNKGWVRIWRKIEDSQLWLLEPFTKGQAWMDLIIFANHKNNTISIRNNIIQINRGQIAWSELTMAKRWQWSRDKVRRYLKYLETIQQIIQQKTALTTIITIVNYNQYQPNDTADNTTDKTTDDTQTIIEELNNEKNTNKEKINKKENFKIPSMDEVREYIYEKGYEKVIDYQKWYNHYNSKDWYIGKNKMKNWHSAVATWLPAGFSVNQRPKKEVEVNIVSSPETLKEIEKQNIEAKERIKQNNIRILGVEKVEKKQEDIVQDKVVLPGNSLSEKYTNLINKFSM